MEQKFSIIIPSHRPELANKTRECLKDFDCIMHDGTGCPSFSKLINGAIMKAEQEIVIIANDKVRPKPEHIRKMIFLFNKGFGFVGLFRFGFFGFSKDLIRTIGFFDERFIGGGFEDVDFGRRLLEADIAIYESPEVPYEHMKSSWDGTK
jgi:GT2 family glycosyltransferase